MTAIPETPQFSCEMRGCHCFGSDPSRLDREANRCRTCEHSVDKHPSFDGIPIAAKLFLTGKTINEALCLLCGKEIRVASRLTAGATGQQTYAFGTVLSHLRTHGIEAPLSPVMLSAPLKPVAYFVFLAEH